MNSGGPAPTYAGYLRLDQLLSAQRPLTNQPDEMLFIIYHQITELWFKLLLHELYHARESLCADSDARCALGRAHEIILQLNGQWAVLHTLTPDQFEGIRPHLRSASGLFSTQYRVLELLLGKRDPHWRRIDAAEWEQPSLFDEYLRHLHRRGHQVPRQLIDRDWRQPRPRLGGLSAQLQAIRSDSQTGGDEAALHDTLASIDAELCEWRRLHLKTVARLIGTRPGTGGTSGIAYLRRITDPPFFPELTADPRAEECAHKRL